MCRVPLSGSSLCRIPAGARAVRFAFAALSYRAPERVVCSTRLERDGKRVVEDQGHRREVVYELLPPGDYALRINAANEAGIWSGQGVQIRFRMEPFYWQTFWFRAGIGALLLAVVFGVAGYWVYHDRLISRLAMAEHDHQAALDRAQAAEALRLSESRRQKAEAEAEWRRQRDAVVRDVHDGIGGLAANLQMTASLALHASESDSRQQHLQILHALARETQGEVRGLMSTLEADVLDCGSVADEFRRYGRLMLGPHGVDLAVDCPEPDAVLAPDPTRALGLFRIYKEAIANIVKHAHARSVQVRLETTAGRLRLEIADDGAGLPETLRAGRGLLSMRRRADDLGGRVEIISGPGLRLICELPWLAEPAPPPNPPAGTSEGHS